MDPIDMTIHPVILCGGTGTRLWPISREMYPKQFLNLVGEHTMLEETLLRVSGPEFAAPTLITNEEHRFIAAEQARHCGVAPADIILEPFGRNTAPAGCLAALKLAEQHGPDSLLLLMPSDHHIADPGAFLHAVRNAVPAASQGRIVTFGVTPDRPETGFGYIHAGAKIASDSDVRQVQSFVEKPDLATAEAYLADGGYLWNAGIFLFQAKAFLDELERFEPGIIQSCRAALAGAKRDLDFCRIEAAVFAENPSLSIDYGVMERTDRAVVAPADMGWNDVGSWSALWELGEPDPAGNVLQGDILTEDASNCYVRGSAGTLIALVGVEDLVVVATDDAILVSRLDRVQDVKAVVEQLKTASRNEHKVHSTVYRPWGRYRRIDTGARFQVKQIVVAPEAKLSLQRHHHRAEHWVVVEGVARVTCDGKSFLLHENQSTYIPIGSVHRLENPGKIPLRLIEVQSGGYLGEDDIVRLDDAFGRV